MQTSMLYTMGMALDRAAEHGHPVRLLVEGAWLEGRIAAVDSLGVVLETDAGHHSVVRLERVAAVSVASESPLRAPITRTPYREETVVRPMPGARTA